MNAGCESSEYYFVLLLEGCFLEFITIFGVIFFPHCNQQGEMVHEKDEGDTVSLFVFGEEESSLAAEAESNNGIIPRERVDNHHFPIDTLVLEKMHAKAVSTCYLRKAYMLGSVIL